MQAPSLISFRKESLLEDGRIFTIIICFSSLSKMCYGCVGFYKDQEGIFNTREVSNIKDTIIFDWYLENEGDIGIQRIDNVAAVDFIKIGIANQIEFLENMVKLS